MDLVPHMYWERQEPGSQLCAQHCLNNLLQQFTYSELDLADIARRLDEAERAQLQQPSRKSHNYDDTGFFSISVLERALEVWDLTLVRWRGEAMKAYQEKPEEQVAFILNLSSHWIPLRRFGASYNSPASLKRWYNLNSFLRAPEWISPTYLRMVLSQAEQEGYSVFCVRKARDAQAEQMEGWGDGGVASLPECQADMFAAQLGEPLDRSGGDIARIGRMNRATVGGSSREPLTTVNPDQPSVDPSSITPPTESADPFESNAAGPSSPVSRSRRRQADPVDPFGEAEGEQAPAPRGTKPPVPVWNVDEDEEIASDEEHFPIDAQEDSHGASDFTRHQRDYDDEDAALQAALKASMEDIPSGWVAPSLEPKAVPRRPSQQTQTNVPPSLGQPVDTAVAAAPVEVAQPERKDTGTTDKSGGSKFKEEIEDDDEPAEELSPDEIRRRRLARFGA